MKIIATSDIHNDKSLIEKLVCAIKNEKPDLVILAGDLGFFFSHPDNLFSTLSKYISSYRIITVLGNHDSIDFAEAWKEIYKIKVLHGDYIKFKNFVIFGIGGGNIPPLFISEEDIKKYLELAKKIKKYNEYYKLILVTHVHPSNTKSELFAEGSKELFKFIKDHNPLLLIHGHIHETGGLEEIVGKTKVINVSRNIVLIEIKENEVKSRKI